MNLFSRRAEHFLKRYGLSGTLGQRHIWKWPCYSHPNAKVEHYSI